MYYVKHIYVADVASYLAIWKIEVEAKQEWKETISSRKEKLSWQICNIRVGLAENSLHWF